MAYTKTPWVDSTSPYISAANLNHAEQGIYDAHAGAGALPSITTVSALESLTGAADGEARMVLGYYVAGDGGGGVMRRNASSIATRNGGTVFTSADGGRWERMDVTKGVYNILHFGAGTGVAASDETAMTNALAAVKAETSYGGVIVFPQGQYYLQGGYDLDNRVNIVGTHWRGPQINHSGNNVCFTMDPTNGISAAANRIENVIIWSTNPTATGARAVLVRELFKARLRNCYFGNYAAAGDGPAGAACVELRNERSGAFTEGTVIDSCFFVNYNTGLLLNRISGTKSFSNTRVINDTQFQNQQANAVAIYVGDGCQWYSGTIECKIMHETQTVGQNTTGIRIGLPASDGTASQIIDTRMNVLHEGWTAGAGVTGTGIKMKYNAAADYESALLNVAGFYELDAAVHMLSHDIEAGVPIYNFNLQREQGGIVYSTTETPWTVVHTMDDFHTANTLIWTGSFASEVICVLSDDKRYIGRWVRVVRSTAATGAGTLNVRDTSTTGTILASLTLAGDEVTLMWNGSGWIVAEYPVSTHPPGTPGLVAISGPSQDQYYFLGTLPASSNSTADHMMIELSGGPNWTSSDLTFDRIMLSNRNAFAYAYAQGGSSPGGDRQNLRVVAYQTGVAGTSVNVYLRGVATHFEVLMVRAYLNDLTSVTELRPAAPSTVVPSGTKVFDSGDTTTYPVNMPYTLGSLSATAISTPGTLASGAQTVTGGVTASGQLAGATGILNYGASLGYGLAAQANSNVTPVTVNANSTAAQNLMSYSVPASLLNVVGRSLRVRGAGVYTTQTSQTPTLTLTLTLGGVTVATFGATAATTAAISNIPWNFEVVITTASTGTSGTVEVHGDFRTKLVSTATTPLNLYPDANTAVSSAINLTTAETLQVQWTFSTNAATANTATQRQMLALLAG